MNMVIIKISWERGFSFGVVFKESFIVVKVDIVLNVKDIVFCFDFRKINKFMLEIIVIIELNIMAIVLRINWGGI